MGRRAPPRRCSRPGSCCSCSAAGPRANLGSLLTNRFSVPGSDAERGLDILRSHFHERGDGAFTLVVQLGRPLSATSRAPRRQPQRGPPRRSRAAKPARPRLAGDERRLRPDHDPAAGGGRQKPHRRACAGRSARSPARARYLTGFPALSHDLQPIYSNDLGKGEAIAVPIALARAAVHVRHARRRGRAVRLRVRDAPDDARARVGRSRTSATWPNT